MSINQILLGITPLQPWQEEILEKSLGKKEGEILKRHPYIDWRYPETPKPRTTGANK